MQVVHTAGLPPNSGRTIFANMGSTTKSRAALMNTANVNANFVKVLGKFYGGEITGESRPGGSFILSTITSAGR